MWWRSILSKSNTYLSTSLFNQIIYRLFLFFIQGKLVVPVDITLMRGQELAQIVLLDISVLTLHLPTVINVLMVRILLVVLRLVPFALLGTTVHIPIWHLKFLVVLVNIHSLVVPSAQIALLDIVVRVQDPVLLHALWAPTP